MIRSEILDHTHTAGDWLEVTIINRFNPLYPDIQGSGLTIHWLVCLGGLVAEQHLC